MGKSRSPLLTLKGETPPRCINDPGNELAEVASSSSSICLGDDCGFPCYRTSSTIDSKLLKDVGISCNLLKPPISKKLIKDSPSQDNILTKRIRAECNELSMVTSKITSYTKNIIKSIQLRRSIDEKPFAEVYEDEQGQRVLKLRLKAKEPARKRQTLLNS